DHFALHLLFEPGDADLEELVEICGCNGEEFDPFQQRRCRVSRLIEHALVEFQPAQLAVEEVLRKGQVRRHRHNRERDSNVTARQKASYILVTKNDRHVPHARMSSRWVASDAKEADFGGKILPTRYR